MIHSYGYILAIAASILWGLTYCLDERVLSSLSVFKLYFLHCLCGVLISAAIMLAQGHSPLGSISARSCGESLKRVAIASVTSRIRHSLPSLRTSRRGRIVL